MTIQIPEAVQWLVPIVVGTNWPEGDEDALRRLAEAWERAAAAINEATGDGDAAAQAALGTMRGATAEAFTQYWNRFVAGDEQFLVTLQRACEELAVACDDTALNIEYTKLSIIAALLILAAQIAAMIAAAWATAGASTAGVPIAQKVAQLVTMQTFRELIRHLAVNLVLNVGVDLAIQGLQALVGNREDWDRGRTADAAVAGATSGVAAGAVGAVSAKLLPVTSTFGQAAARGAGEGAVTGAASNYLIEATHGNVRPDRENLTSGAVAGGIGGALSGMTNRHRGLDETWYKPEDSNYQAGPNHQGWRFKTPGGTEVRVNVDNPYSGSWNSQDAKDLPSRGGPNSVRADDEDSLLPTTLHPPADSLLAPELPEPERHRDT